MFRTHELKNVIILRRTKACNRADFPNVFSEEPEQNSANNNY